MKKEYIILAIVIVGLAAYLSLRNKDQAHYELPQLQAVDSAKINRILITKTGSVMELAKKDDHWFIEPQGFPADKIKVQNILKAATELKLTALVSESGNYDRYDLTDNKKVTVQIFSDGQKQRDFDLGRAAPTFQHTFVKLEGDKQVYHARGSLQKTVDQTIENLRDKIVLSFDQQTITTLDLEKGEQKITLLKKETKTEASATENKDGQPETPPVATTQWQNAEGQKVDQTAVERLLSSFSHLQCDGFAEDKKKEELNNPAWHMSFKNDQGDTFSFSAYGKEEKEEGKIVAASSGSDYVFLLTESRSQSFEKHVTKLLGIEDKSK